MTGSPYDDSRNDSHDDERPAPTFAQLGVPGPLVRVLARDGKREAFPIQADTLPDSLAGRDVLGRGRTGSGKTLAFSIPLVARLAQSRRRVSAERIPHPRGMVLAPTRELANQINEVLAPLAQAYGMTTATIYGGVKQSRQERELRAGAEIIVACPGRLEDLLGQHVLSLESVEIAVLDEADEMADMGFLPAVDRLLAQIAFDSQCMLFSATLDHGVDALVEKFLDDPKEHAVDSATASVDEMTHHVFETTHADKHELVRTLASGTGKRILFTRTKFQAKKLAKNLTKNGIPAAELHGNLSQNQRDRNLAAFESGEVRVMVATDVAARGIDVSGVELVVQVEPPADPKSFLHRSGRTARAGHAGDVVTLVLPEQRRETRTMLRRAGIKAKPVEVTHDSPEVLELVGQRAEKVDHWELSPLKPKRSHAVGEGRGRGRGRADRHDAGRRDAGRHDSRQGQGGKRIHRKPIRVVSDERGEDAKRHERRMNARRNSGAERSRGERNPMQHRRNKSRKRSAPFRMGR
ncbi:DEAD/DEAH box helicase [Bifidobacterium simiarum]|uniref:DEAD/DEAH box helicase n=1 Tax=Bifidobacterium simiarum TaxID=2045441 RepID=UPI001BDBB75A|nr:DEAD/DEAH box helicase [Bifidobacterium simiarum]MBT1166860.1 DEAD/DEAH box helicase [Bifidobacterium simiarum]